MQSPPVVTAVDLTESQRIGTFGVQYNRKDSTKNSIWQTNVEMLSVVR